MSNKNQNSLDQHQRECAKLLRENAYRHRLHQVFSDFCEMSALAISNAVDKAKYDNREARYMEIVGRYERDEVNRFARMLGCLTESMEGGLKDCFGALFMSLELGDQYKGQFFTPYEVSYLMAKLTVGLITMADIEAAGGFLTFQEPAVGAGAMVIATAQSLQEAGINYQRHMHVTAIDIDKTAVHMAYIQLALLHVPAIVIHGNTLSLKEWDHWVTPAHVMGGWDWRLRRRLMERERDPLKQRDADAARQDSPVDGVTESELVVVRDDIVHERTAAGEQMGLF